MAERDDDTIRFQINQTATAAAKTIPPALSRLHAATKDIVDETSLLRREARRTRSSTQLRAMRRKIEETPTVVDENAPKHSKLPKSSDKP